MVQGLATLLAIEWDPWLGHELDQVLALEWVLVWVLGLEMGLVLQLALVLGQGLGLQWVQRLDLVLGQVGVLVQKQQVHQEGQATQSLYQGKPGTTLLEPWILVEPKRGPSLDHGTKQNQNQQHGYGRVF